MDQTVNLNAAFDDSFDNPSPTTSTRSGGDKSRMSTSRKNFAAPGRPTKYATRPSHVNIKREDLDNSLIGVVEGRVSFHRTNRHKGILITSDGSVTGVQTAGKQKKTAWDKTKASLVLLLKVAVVTSFVAYGIFVIASFSAPGSDEASKDGILVKPGTIEGRSGELPSKVQVTNADQNIVNIHVTHHPQEIQESVASAARTDKDGEKVHVRSGEIQGATLLAGSGDNDEVKVHVSHHSQESSNRNGELQGAILAILVSDAATDDDATHSDVRVHVSHHNENPSHIPLTAQNKIYALEQIILQHEISLPSVLNYSFHVETNMTSINPQVRALTWMAHSDAFDVADASRDVQHEKLLQRYALGVLYYSLGGHHRKHHGDTALSQMEREAHVLHSETEGHSTYQGWRRKSQWMSTSSVCEWYGIHCDSNKMVTSLNLTENQLKGPLPMLELFQALRVSLKTFDLSRNEISGSIDQLPVGIGSKAWMQLEYFYINANQISGNPPLGWFGMSSESHVMGINMACNLFSAELGGISNLQNLSELYLSNNGLQGALPSFSNLPSLGTTMSLLCLEYLET